ncbi:MAG: hypothetical protein LUH07_13095 [Lachnospiraceae bacterium]|nr:hypothetical protein [Lachnospiraceae bacterium]
MIDFHSHILPAMDDGSSSVEESLAMLQMSYQQGVREMIATSHFYAAQESPSVFLRRRRQAWEKLEPQLSLDMPEVRLGAEVYYFNGIYRTDELPELCIEGTNILLLEMPFASWTERMVSEVISISTDLRIRVLLAHIDRYLSYQTEETWDTLEENGILFQLNASSVLDGFLMRRKAVKLIKNGRIDVLGSDCHNMTSRQPNLEQAMEIIRKKAGEAAVEELTERGKELLGY